MAQLSRRGLKKQPVIMPLSVEDELASPLVRWIEVLKVLYISNWLRHITVYF